MFEQLAKLIENRARRRDESVVHVMLAESQVAARKINNTMLSLAPQLASRQYWHERDLFLSIAIFHFLFDNHLYSVQCEEAHQGGGNRSSERLNQTRDAVLEGWHRHAPQCYQEYETVYDNLKFETSEEMMLQSLVRLSGCGASREKKLNDGTPAPAMGIWYIASVNHGRCLQRVGTGVPLTDYNLPQEDILLAKQLVSQVESYEDE